MLLKFFFKYLSVATQAKFMKKRGIVLGTRAKRGRQIYLYMVNNLFAEIQFEKDNPGLPVEELVLIDGLKKLNMHLEKDARSAVSSESFFG
jgi:hypothetical protein